MFTCCARDAFLLNFEACNENALEISEYAKDLFPSLSFFGPACLGIHFEVRLAFFFVLVMRIEFHLIERLIKQTLTCTLINNNKCSVFGIQYSAIGIRLSAQSWLSEAGSRLVTMMTHHWSRQDGGSNGCGDCILCYIKRVPSKT